MDNDRHNVFPLHFALEKKPKYDPNTLPTLKRAKRCPHVFSVCSHTVGLILKHAVPFCNSRRFWIMCSEKCLYLTFTY